MFRPALLLLLGLILAVKILAVLARGPVPIELDAAGYWDLGTTVLEGDPWMLSQPIAYRTPVYPWFLAAVRLVADSQALPAILLLQGALFLATAWLAALLARLLTGRHETVAVTLLIQVPAVAATTYVAAVLTEVLFTFLLMLNLFAVARYADRPGVGRALFVGGSFAATLLTRPIVLLLWIPHLAFLLLVLRRRRMDVSRRESARPIGDRTTAPRALLLHAVVAVTVAAAMTVPWMMRNRQLFGRPFLTEFVGRNLWVVTFQDGSGAGLPLPDSPAGRELRTRLDRVDADVDWRLTWSVSRALSRSGLDDAEGDRLMKQVATDAIREQPVPFFAKGIRRVVNFWRTPATELPGPSGVLGSEAGIADHRALTDEEREARFRRQPVWNWHLAWLESWITHRFSRSVLANTALTLLIGAATLITMWHRPTRAAGLWIASIFLYFSLITGLLEIPAYRYRMVIEPLAATAIACAVGVLQMRTSPTATDDNADAPSPPDRPRHRQGGHE